jgi:uncharacterized membrane protein HdeD (DUF308 family)
LVKVLLIALAALTWCITHKKERRKKMKEQSTTDVFKKVTGMSIGLAVLMIVLGFLAVALPLATGIGVSILVGWIVVFGGFTYVAYAFTAEGAGAFLWRMLIGIVYVVGGFYLVFHPALALQSLTLVLAAILIAEGVLQMIVFFKFRSLPGSGWVLFDGIVTLLLGFMIAYPWPFSAGWAIGTLVGINLLVSGFTRLMYSVAARKELKATA